MKQKSWKLLIIRTSLGLEKCIKLNEGSCASLWIMQTEAICKTF